MTINCNNCAVAEMRLNGVIYARRNCAWTQITTCYDVDCVCGGNAEDYENIPLIHWVELPAGENTIEVYGVRVGRSSVESQTEVAVWRKTCPPLTTNVICIPAAVIVEQGLCEFERLAALHGAMVGCVEVTGQCTQAPDTYIAALNCLPTLCEPEPVGTCDGCDINDPPLPGGGVLMNTITFNYPFETKVQILWHTAFVQDFVGGCECVA